MRLYRVHPWLDDVAPEEPFGASYVPPGQGAGRWDNPDLYTLRYFSTTPEGAVAETFGGLAIWSTEMFRVPSQPRAIRALSTYEVAASARLADLADPAVLVSLGINRVTDVTERNKRRTQRLAAQIHATGEWDGISWWSYYHPTITLAGLWLDDGIDLVSTSPLRLTDSAVQDASQRIVRQTR